MHGDSTAMKQKTNPRKVAPQGEKHLPADINGKMTKAELLEEFTRLHGSYGRLRDSGARQKKKLKELQGKVDALQAVSQAWVRTDSQSLIVDVNENFCQVSGYCKDELLGTSMFDLYKGDDKKKTGVKIRSSLKKNSHWQGEVLFCRKKKRNIPSWIYINCVKGRNGEVENYVVTLLDITAFKKSQEKYHLLAHYDPLTKLPNRSLMYDRLNQTITLAKRHNFLVGVMLLDLDRFKDVNDTLGHHVGDQLLVETSKRLQKVVRESDTVARMGGDEFLIILSEVGNPNNAAHIAQKFLDSLSAPFHLAGYEMFISGSIGISFYPTDNEDPNTLIKNSDTAMYHAKAQGKNTYKFFTEDINKSTLDRFILENRFRQALDKLEFQLNYQPKVDARTGRILGMEALLRWHHPDHGSVKPNLFIPLAEETGLVVPLGEWALREACRQNKAWQDEGLRPLRVSVNLSARQFKKRDLIETIQTILDETGLEPRYLMLEITESTVIDDIDDTILTLRTLRSMGIGASIDDFGTGYSSLNYLNRFALDELKIDMSFISDLSKEENCKVVIAIIAMAHGLKHQVVAEGVETKEQLEFLRNNDCDEIQGFYFSRPKNANDFHRMLKEDPLFL